MGLLILVAGFDPEHLVASHRSLQLKDLFSSDASSCVPELCH